MMAGINGEMSRITSIFGKHNNKNIICMPTFDNFHV